MKASLNWIKEYVDVGMPPDELGHLLTMTGLEVEGLEAVGQGLDDVIVAKILKVAPHPNADRLTICSVDTGQGRVEVVCGAPNVAEGALAPLVLAGGKLPNGTRMKESRIRGEVSRGMLLAEDEMGLTDDHTGIMILAPDLTPGASLLSVLPFPDWVFDLSITPNRPDCANVLGIAREIAAVTGRRLRKPEIELEESGPAIEDLTKITIIEPDGCPRYAAGIIQDVELGTSPFWMRYRLYQSGIRSISNLVDVSNYVMLEMGQPLHAFDYDRLRENRIVVRRAVEGETFTTLDGEARRLNHENLMICDGERAVALAGIMGGLNSEIFAGTRNVLVESAFFDPVTIRRGSKHLGISTEASYRFERGADIGGATSALKRAVSLMCRLAGGKIAKGIIDNYPKVFTPPVIHFRKDKTNRILGTSISMGVMKGYFEALEMEVHDVNGNTLEVKPPSFRVDIKREVDLIEEVARLYGFDKIPLTYPSIRPSEEGDAQEILIRDRIRSIMRALGFTEIITYSFISPDSADMLGAEEDSDLRLFTSLMNPLTVDQSVLRTSLVPGLMTTVKTNILHEGRDLRFFEWGKTFFRKEGDQQPIEKICLAAIMTGLCQEKSWYEDERHFDFYDIKGAAEALLKSLGLEGVRFQRKNGFPGLDPEGSSGIYCSDRLIGQVGRVASSVVEAYDLKIDRAYLFELDVEALLTLLSVVREFCPFPKFPAVFRDISILVERRIESAKIIEIIRKEGGELLESVRIFDFYEGEKVDPSEKALSFRISYRSAHETLEGEKVNGLHESIIDKIRHETGGRLREG
jgi:phenylalanyl-tRNA synthetase beta chain